MTLIETVMPEYERREFHRRPTAAPADGLWAAIHNVTTGELSLARALMALRAPGRRAYAPGPVLASFERMGFRVLAQEPARELLLGGIGRFWRPSGGLVRLATVEQFAAFAVPGYAKVAFNFRLGGGTLSTETRIAGTDARARRLFSLYWVAVRPWSGVIRREWLRAIARRATAEQDQEPSPSIRRST